MLRIQFFSAANYRKDINKATEIYRNIWEKDGARIVKATERISSLKFKEKDITAFSYNKC